MASGVALTISGNCCMIATAKAAAKESDMTQTPDSKTLSQQRYTEYADGYVTSETHAKGSDLDRLLAIAEPQSHWQMLDVATGGGHTALKFAPHVQHVIASDLTPRMLEKAEQFIVAEQGAGNVSFRQADAENLPFEEARFDLVTCRIAPHHFPNAQAFVRECARVLKQGGLLLLQDQLLPDEREAAFFVDDFERLRDPSHHRAFNTAEWQAMFAAAGLVVEHSEEYIKRHDFLDWAKRQGNDVDIITELTRMLREASAIARDWMAPQNWGTEAASFANRHILIRGRAN